MKEFLVATRERSHFVDITRNVDAAVRALGIQNGAVMVFVPHTTAAVTINENADPDVLRDLCHALDNTVPWTGNYRHCEGNSAAHVKASLLGSSLLVPVENAQLRLGTWQAIYLAEFDGPRTRQVWVTTTA